MTEEHKKYRNYLCPKECDYSDDLRVIHSKSCYFYNNIHTKYSWPLLQFLVEDTEK